MFLITIKEIKNFKMLFNIQFKITKKLILQLNLDMMIKVLLKK